MNDSKPLIPPRAKIKNVEPPEDQDDSLLRHELDPLVSNWYLPSFLSADYIDPFTVPHLVSSREIANNQDKKAETFKS